MKCECITGQTSSELSHTHFNALTIKNAVVDQLREQYEERPSVNIENPDLPLLLYIHRGKAQIYRIWSGHFSMHKRGYRSVVHKASLRETTAAAMYVSCY